MTTRTENSTTPDSHALARRAGAGTLTVRRPWHDPLRSPMLTGVLIGLLVLTSGLIGLAMHKFDDATHSLVLSAIPTALTALLTAWMVRTGIRQINTSTHHQQRERERLAMTLDNMNVGTFVCDDAGRLQMVNKRLSELTGWSAERLMSEWSPLLHPDDRTRVLDLWKATVPAQKDFDSEHRLRLDDGTERWVRVEVRPLTWQRGEGDGWSARAVGTVQDITALRQQREALRESEERLSLVLDSMDLAAWDWNPQTGRVIKDARWSKMLGYDVNDIGDTTRDWERLLHAEDVRTVMLKLHEHLEGMTDLYEVETRLLCRDGQYRWVRARGRVVERDKDGRAIRMVGTHEDIHDAKIAKAAADEARQRLDLVLKGTSEGVWDWQIASKSVFFSTRFCQILGFDPGELTGTYDGFIDRVHRDDAPRLINAINNHIETEDRLDLEVRMRTRAGKWRWVRLRGQAAWDGQGRAVRVCGSMSDIQPFKDNEARLAKFAEDLQETKHAVEEQAAQLAVQAQELELARQAAEAANMAKSNFLANMSHEIRTPMTAIMGFSDMLLDVNQSAEDRVECIATIRRAGEHLLGLINNILDLSKIEAGAMTVERLAVNPVQIIREAENLLRVKASEKQLVLGVDLVSPVPEFIQTDPLRLRQVMTNLLSNAVKFTDAGGVRVMVRFEPSASENDGRLDIEIHDTGIGMTPEQLSRIFIPFGQADESMSRRFGGTGLGLTICRRLVEMLGGEIRVSSTPGVGSMFGFWIPTGPVVGQRMIDGTDASGALTIEPRRAPAPSGATGPLAGRRILLAEDGPDNQRLLTMLLRKAGAIVTMVDNGQAAVDAATDAAEAGIAFNLILMDMQMPVLDGYGATGKLRTAGYSGIIVALTAHAMAGDEERCRLAGCDGYLTKPIDRTRLINETARWCGVRRVEASGVVEYQMISGDAAKANVSS
jgi:PAS domain S-box-containing protein